MLLLRGAFGYQLHVINFLVYFYVVDVVYFIVIYCFILLFDEKKLGLFLFMFRNVLFLFQA